LLMNKYNNFKYKKRIWVHTFIAMEFSPM